MNTEDLLANIDRMLADHGTSNDAVRWRPPELPCSTPFVGVPRDRVERLVQLGYDGYAAEALARWEIRQGLAAVAAYYAEVARNVRRIGQMAIEAFKPMAKAFAQLQTIEPQPARPADPKALALYLRQHRNTGPTRPRLDGRRAR